jgi:hypothetical protein
MVIAHGNTLTLG